MAKRRRSQRETELPGWVSDTSQIEVIASFLGVSDRQRLIPPVEAQDSLCRALGETSFLITPDMPHYTVRGVGATALWTPADLSAEKRQTLHTKMRDLLPNLNLPKGSFCYGEISGWEIAANGNDMPALQVVLSTGEASGESPDPSHWVPIERVVSYLSGENSGVDPPRLQIPLASMPHDLVGQTECLLSGLLRDDNLPQIIEPGNRLVFSLPPQVYAVQPIACIGMGLRVLPHPQHPTP